MRIGEFLDLLNDKGILAPEEEVEWALRRGVLSRPLKDAAGRYDYGPDNVREALDLFGFLDMGPTNEPPESPVGTDGGEDSKPAKRRPASRRRIKSYSEPAVEERAYQRSLRPSRLAAAGLGKRPD